MLNLVFPRCCPICSEIVMPKGQLICPSCYQQLSFVKEPTCKKCGKMIYSFEREYCGDCQKYNHVFEGGWALLNYNVQMQHSLAKFKYHNKREYQEWYVEALLKRYRKDILRIRPDYILPVPLYKWKKRVRGYNQAELLAKGISQGIGIKTNANLLIRCKNTKPLKEMNPGERRQVLSGAFQVKESLQDVNTVLLVDDIYTTGSTIDACSKVLKAAGVKQVYYISVCIGSGEV